MKTMLKQVELLFIRHGQGIHNTDIPDRALGEERLTRDDFLGEAGIRIMKWME